MTAIMNQVISNDTPMSDVLNVINMPDPDDKNLINALMYINSHEGKYWFERNYPFVDYPDQLFPQPSISRNDNFYLISYKIEGQDDTIATYRHQDDYPELILENPYQYLIDRREI